MVKWIMVPNQATSRMEKVVHIRGVSMPEVSREFTCIASPVFNVALKKNVYVLVCGERIAVQEVGRRSLLVYTICSQEHGLLELNR